MYKKILFLFVVFGVSFTVWANDANIDDLRKQLSTTTGEERLTVLYNLTRVFYSQPDSLSYYLDLLEAEANEQKASNFQCQVIMTKMEYLQMMGHLQELETYSKKNIPFLREQKNYYLLSGAEKTLITTLLYLNKESEALQRAKDNYEEAKKLNSPELLTAACYTLGYSYRVTDRAEEAYFYFGEALKHAQKSENSFTWLCQIYPELADIEVITKRYMECINTCNIMLEMFDKKQKEEVLFDFSPYSFSYLCTQSTAYTGLGNYDEAKKCLDKAESMIQEDWPIMSLFTFYFAYLGYYENTGNYEEALRCLDQIIEWTFDDDEMGKLTSLKHKADILFKLQDYKEAATLYYEIQGKKDSLNTVQFAKQLDELRTEYEIDKHIAEKERNRNYFLFALSGCLLLAMALGIWIIYNRRIVRKNHDLYRKIKEQDRLAKELEIITKEYEQIETQGDVETGRAPSLPGNRQQRKLVSHLREYLLKDRNFANPDMDIQELIPAMATNRTYLFEALKTVTGKTPMEYINHLRLDEAKQLLDADSNLTIEAIAMDCGFYTYSTFFRLFREYYRISPAEYRKIARE